DRPRVARRPQPEPRATGGGDGRARRGAAGVVRPDRRLRAGAVSTGNGVVVVRPRPVAPASPVEAGATGPGGRHPRPVPGAEPEPRTGREVHPLPRPGRGPPGNGPVPVPHRA